MHWISGARILLSVICTLMVVAGLLTPAIAGPQSTEIEWISRFGGAQITAETDVGKSVAASGDLVVAVGTTTGLFPGYNSVSSLPAYVQMYNASGNLSWTRQFSANTADDVDLHGGVIYVTGYTASVLPGQTGQGDYDAYIRAYDENGTELWTRQFGSDSMDFAYGVVADDSGVYVVGMTYGVFPGQSRSGSTDAFVRKYEVNGTELWTRQFGSPADTRAYAVAANSEGIWVVGDVLDVVEEPPDYKLSGFLRRYTADGAFVWDRRFGAIGAGENRSVAADDTSVYVAGHSNNDVFVQKYTLSGDIAWTKSFETSDPDAIHSLSANGSGIFVAGYIEGAFPEQTNMGGVDAYARYYSADGNVIWTRQFGTQAPDVAAGIATTASEIYVVGITEGTLPNQTSLGQTDAFLRRYTTDGSESWTHQVGTVRQFPILDKGHSVSVGDGIYVAGDTFGALPSQTHAGGRDAFLSRRNPDGSELWTRQYGTAAEDSAKAIISTGSDIYMAGYTAGALPGQASSGGKDAYIRKYDDGGTELWTHQFGTESNDDIRGIALDNTGIYLVGSTEGALPQHTNPGGVDAFIRKYAPDCVCQSEIASNDHEKTRQ